MSAGRITATNWATPGMASLPSFPGSLDGPGAGDFSTADGEEFLAEAGVKKGKPVVVFVESKEQVRDAGGHTYEQSHFADERIAIGTKLFGLVKIREGTPLA